MQEFFNSLLTFTIVAGIITIINQLSTIITKLPKPQKVKLTNFVDNSDLPPGEILIILQYLPNRELICKRPGGKQLYRLFFYEVELIND